MARDGGLFRSTVRDSSYIQPISLGLRTHKSKLRAWWQGVEKWVEASPDSVLYLQHPGPQESDRTMILHFDNVSEPYDVR